ncbi:MAG: heme d1 biosynthesis radical SAM protein NirJ [Alphaproteobacteria bacterium]|nr:heme d1 biosynthesis radical SAM protein NirJ [Alphaproteobacteria bacterium]
MFRLSQYLAELDAPTALPPLRGRPAPVVIWNLIRRCNLKCRHCYANSADADFAGELTSEEAFATLHDLRESGVKVLILSGGEPLLRPDIFEISAEAKRLGFYVGLSSNGTLIDDAMADRVAAVGYDYVGISLDGIGSTHDRFRRQSGAFVRSLAALRRCRERGLKTGLRFTLTRDNAAELPAMLDLVEDERIDKFFLSHLNYGGRGNRNRGDDAWHQLTRAAMLYLFERARDWTERGLGKDVVTGNNDADAAFFLEWVAQRRPDRVEHLRARLERWGGNAAGLGIANIDTRGLVHPDTFWWHHAIGDVRRASFAEIWRGAGDPVLAGLRISPRPVKGRCAGCRFLSICNGNSRIRALQVNGDPWQEDPACYLTDAEIGVATTRTPIHAALH